MQATSGNNSPVKAAAVEAMEVDEEFKLSEITTLSKNAIRDICEGDKNPEVKGKTFFVQAADVKIFTEADNKKNIRQR